MITKQEYLKAKAIVDEYEEQERKQTEIEAMYCVPCQAFIEQECFCKDEDICSYCGEIDSHRWDCVYFDDSVF